MTAERLLKTILVVDDDEMVRKLVVSTLKKSGYKTRVAADGKEAVFILKGISG